MYCSNNEIASFKFLLHFQLVETNIIQSEYVCYQRYKDENMDGYIVNYIYFKKQTTDFFQKFEIYCADFWPNIIKDVLTV